MADYRGMLGRGTDNTMAHMTPGEAVIPRGSMTPKLWAAYQEALDRQGMAPEQYVVGSGQESINPATGQPEFLAQASLPGRAVRDFQRDYPEPRESQGGALPTSPEMGGTIPRRQQQAMVETVPQEQWAQEGGEFGQMKTADLDPLMSILPGPIEAGLKMAGVDPTYEYFDPMLVPGMPFEARRTSLGRESEQKSFANPRALSTQRAVTQESVMRPMEMPIPQFLSLSSAMTPLQMRTAIASRAVAGPGGQYTSPEAQSFYDNLLKRSLIGDDNSLFGLDTLLPIDLQYLAQVRGIENPAGTQALLAALG